MDKLTGRKRYRSNWRGKVILQVEVLTHHMKDLNGSGHYDEYDVKTWRDAQITDLVIESGGRGNG